MRAFCLKLKLTTKRKGGIILVDDKPKKGDNLMISKASALKAKEAVKHARKNGRVMNLSQAFEMYPVSDEWHEGKIENIRNSKGETNEV